VESLNVEIGRRAGQIATRWCANESRGELFQFLRNHAFDARNLLKDKFTLGGDASVAAGPVGRAAAAETDAAMNAKILSYSRSKGAFAGLELKGTTLNQDNNANKALYGKEMDAKEIMGGQVQSPAAAKPVIDVLTKYSPKGK
jgi:lipid-binding SYLF domain-containing protein